MRCVHRRFQGEHGIAAFFFEFIILLAIVDRSIVFAVSATGLRAGVDAV